MVIVMLYFLSEITPNYNVILRSKLELVVDVVVVKMIEVVRVLINIDVGCCLVEVQIGDYWGVRCCLTDIASSGIFC